MCLHFLNENKTMISRRSFSSRRKQNEMIRWRQSASLILLGRKPTTITEKTRFDYGTLLLKRSPTMRFAPDISTFPGGKLDQSDLSLDWPKYLSSSVSLDRFTKKSADIYHDIDHPYPGLVFRLCAIRETFEETGLLIAKSRSPSSSQFSSIFNLSNDLSTQWREKIRRDASQFLHMCKEIHVEPDVHSLFDWCQYLAASIAKVRFDTIFYLTALPSTVSCSIAKDDEETVSADWLPVDVTMRNYRQNQINFLPPQIYELSRLANFEKLEKLIDFLSKRDQVSTYQIKRLLAICYKTPQEMLLVMPGDEDYPSDASFDTPVLSSNKPLDESQDGNKNRLVMKNKGDDRKWHVRYQMKTEPDSSEFSIRPLTNGWENHA